MVLSVTLMLSSRLEVLRPEYSILLSFLSLISSLTIQFLNDWFSAPSKSAWGNVSLISLVKRFVVTFLFVSNSSLWSMHPRNCKWWSASPAKDVVTKYNSMCERCFNLSLLFNSNTLLSSKTVLVLLLLGLPFVLLKIW